jgi:urea transporter
VDLLILAVAITCHAIITRDTIRRGQIPLWLIIAFNVTLIGGKIAVITFPHTIQSASLVMLLCLITFTGWRILQENIRQWLLNCLTASFVMLAINGIVY